MPRLCGFQRRMLQKHVINDYTVCHYNSSAHSTFMYSEYSKECKENTCYSLTRMVQMTAESHATVAAFAIPLTSMDKSPGLQNASKDRYVKEPNRHLCF